MKIGTNYSFKNQQSSNPNFGVLYMPKLAAGIEKERPYLEWLAQDVDIFVKLEEMEQKLAVNLQEVTHPAATTINRFQGFVSLSEENLGSKLYAKALDLKIQFEKIFHPRIPDDSKTPSLVSTIHIISYTPSPIRNVS